VKGSSQPKPGEHVHSWPKPHAFRLYERFPCLIDGIANLFSGVRKHSEANLMFFLHKPVTKVLQLSKHLLWLHSRPYLFGDL
jgi:hypothetical protein